MAERKKPWIWLLVAAAVLFFGCLSTCLGTAFYCGKSSLDATAGARRTLDTFFTQVTAGHHKEAYEATSEGFRANITVANFVDEMRSRDVEGARPTVIELEGIDLRAGTTGDTSRARFRFALTLRNGRVLEGTAEAMVEGDAWRVHRIDFVADAPAQAAPRDASAD